MTVDTNHFPTAIISMVDPRLPRDQRNGKAKFMPMQFIQKQSFRPQLKINLFSNEPPQDPIGPAIVESLSDSSEETDGPIVLCSRCKANVISTEPKEKPLRALKYMQEFHKKYSANDLYSLRRAYQDILDLVLACPDAECIIQKTLDPRIKARYQHIFNVPNEEAPVNISHEYIPLPAKDSHIENVHKQDTPLESPTHPKREHDPMVDFVATDETELATRENKIQAALGELFPHSSSINLHHLKSLYVTAHIKGYLVSKIFVACGAIINIMPISIMKALRRSNDEFIPSGVTMSNFVDDKF
ncbi:hypothetical protein D8674_038418 [Pyrus ussuriensis x Pyrus communis]|uniref:Uncharacterized protein n=1 Tax=Pyrus ussuriensis x Pyrus communis TaxID=2448454 RepID=A0A5N5FCK3_9ROSA|nr:hypothetical protein D8674_038418 [Pyrus ussuriensis x Pyrus communis]